MCTSGVSYYIVILVYLNLKNTWTTWRWDTRIWLLNTFLVLTNKSSLAIRVNDTFRFASRDGIRIWNQTWLASTDGIASPCN